MHYTCMLTIIFKHEKKQQKFKDITIKSTKTTQRKHVTKKYVEHNITICICKFLQKIHTHTPNTLRLHTILISDTYTTPTINITIIILSQNLLPIHQFVHDHQQLTSQH